MAYRRIKHRFDEEEIKNMIKEIFEIFNKYNLPLWLDYGTLLGAVRNGKLIPWDNDVDFGAWAKSLENKEIRKKITKELMKKGYTPYFLWYGINMEKNAKIGRAHV